MKTIKICMGSSCFARENRENLCLIEDYLNRHKLTDSVRIEGSLCLGRCSEGPNLEVNGTRYTQVLPSQIDAILHKELQPQ